MCGIAGYIKGNDFQTGLIQSMIERIKHRGPDYTGYFDDERISLAHARLSILDLSAEANQPFLSNDGRFVMIYNGEVYNFKELADEMHYQAKTSSDTEIILELYCRNGDDFIEKLNGMFAIVIYDKESGELKMWRDRFGIKPLCYYWDGKHFAFASELKALYELPVKKEIDEQALGDFLFLEYIPQPRTIFKHFHKLGNGQKLTFREGRLKTEKYYDILDHTDQVDVSENEALEIFEDLFDKSVSYRKISDVPLGAFLSGGNDSSAVCASLKKQNENVLSFNIGFENKQYDESEYAKKVAQHLGLNHRHYQLNYKDLLENYQTLVDQFDEPFAVASIYPTFKVSQLAKKEVTVALSGDGGDELFMGYGHYNWYKRLKKFDSSTGKFARYGSAQILSMLPPRYKRISQLLKYDTLENNWPHVWSQEQYMFSENEVNRLTSRYTGGNSLTDSWKEIQSRVPSPLLQRSLFDIKHYLADDLLYKVDMASMKNSLEVRLPFLDHKLVEFALSVPDHLKIKNGQSKYMLKKHLENHLPSNLIYRKKWGFGAPVDQWLGKELKEDVQNLLNPNRIKNQGLIDPEFTKDILYRFNTGEHYLYKRVYALLSLQKWMDRYNKD